MSTKPKPWPGLWALLCLPLLASCGFFEHQEETPPTFNTPLVFLVTTTATPGVYGVGAVIPIVVKLTAPVIVTGTPQILLETGATDAVATYVAGSGTTELIFNYTVELGHNTADLDYVDTDSFTLNDGSIKGAENVAASLNLDEPGDERSLAGTSNIIVDTVAPTITNVTSSTSNGSYVAGEEISIQVNFSEVVEVTGTPTLTLETGATDAVVNYASGSGTSSLTFTYTVAAGEETADLDYIPTSALALNGGTIRDAGSFDADLTLAAPGAAGSLGNAKALVVDAVIPTVAGVSSSASDGTYKLADVIPIRITFSETVIVTGTPRITLETGASNAAVSYSSGSGSNVLVFNYTVAAGHEASDLDYVNDSSLALNSGTIRDAAGNNATLTLATPGDPGSLANGKALVVDGIVPTVTGVTSGDANGRYTTAQSLSISVSFSEAVTVTGVPQLVLETGSTDATADYASGSGTSTLVFTYTVGAGQNSTDLDYVDTSSLTLNGATIKDSSLNDANRTLAAAGAAGSLGANKAFVIDTLAPTVTSVSSSTTNGTYRAGQAISITVNLSETVTVTGVPQLTLETGASDAVATYASGSGSTSLVFTYTIGAGENSADLDYALTSSLTATGATIRDAVNIDANLALPTPGATGSLAANKALVVDTTAPTVSGVTASNSNGSYGVGQTINVQVVMSEVVTVTGVPRLTLETGGTDAVVNYASGSGSTTLVFTYTVSTGDVSADLDYQSDSALALNSGTIKDTAGNDATLTLAAPGAAGSLANSKALVVDGIAPTVSNVTATQSNGTYGFGQTLNITVEFSEAVTVTGTPTLTLETGSSDGVASWASGSGTTILTFNYTIAAGQTATDLEYGSTSSLALSGGTIRDAATNAATLDLPSPGSAGSLGTNKNLAIATPGTSLAIAGSVVGGMSGYAVAIVGDIDGDGKADYAVGEPYATGAANASGRVRVRSGADDSVILTLDGESANAGFGFSVAAAGDVNRDGRPDIVVGEPFGDDGGTDSGNVYVYSGRTGSRFYTVNGDTANAQRGYAVAGAGDINRDGRPDILIGEPYGDPPGLPDAGRAFVYSGANQTLTLRTINGTEVGALLGYSVAGMGDVNRDGRADFMVGQPLFDGAGTDRGRVIVYSGATAVTNLHSLTATEDNAQFGYSVAVLGDIDSDGLDDFIVGAPRSTSDDGKAYVYSGANSAAPLYEITGSEADAQLGYAVAKAGDINRDGRPDFIVGQPYADNGGSDRGKAYVHSGSGGAVLYTVAGSENGATLGAALSATGDLNRDGKADFIVGSPLSDSSVSDGGSVLRLTSGFTTLPAGSRALLYTVDGAEANAETGGTVVNVGDANGDGEDDFLVAEPEADTDVDGDATDDQGAVYLYSGASGALLHALEGAEDGAKFGYSISGGGDVNGDGKNDFIVGEPFAANGGNAYIYSGATGALLNTLTASEPGNEFGRAVAIVGDVDADGKADVVVSEPSAANGGTNRGIVHLYSGADIAGGLAGVEPEYSRGGTVDGMFLGDRVAGAGDYDGDGRADILIAASESDFGGADSGRVMLLYEYNGSEFDNVRTITGAAGDRLGFSLAPAGDVDGNGEDDFVVGSPASGSTGKVEVYGNANSSAAILTLTVPFGASSLGHAVSGAGDVNGDGRFDLVVGDPDYNNPAVGGSEEGVVYVYSGSTGNVLHTVEGGEASGRLGSSVGGGGDANRDGKADFVIGAPVEGAADEGKAYLYVAPSN